MREIIKMDPEMSPGADANLVIGIDGHIKGELERLNFLDPDSAEFKKTWDELNQYIKLYVQENIAKVYELAGARDLICEEKVR